MGKVTRDVTVEGEGEYLTAEEIMLACAQVPADIIPTVQISMGGKIKSLKFKVEVLADGN
jgi:hypothetical protein